MLRGLYTAASGMVAQQKRQDVTANNLANVNTTGFRREEVTFRPFPEVLLHRLAGAEGKPVPVGFTNMGVLVDHIHIVFEQGYLEETRRPADLALTGEGFFVLETADGIRYTRAGAFQVDKDGFLVTPDGDYLLGRQGPLQVGTGDFTVSASGEVRVGDRVIDYLRIAVFTQGAPVQRIGPGQFAVNLQYEQQVERPNIRQGVLEKSNVNYVTEMGNLLAGLRAYQISQRVLQAQDETLGKVVNEVGAVR